MGSKVVKGGTCGDADGEMLGCWDVGVRWEEKEEEE